MRWHAARPGSGYTLVEIMVTGAILAVLASLVGLAIGRTTRNARIEMARQDLERIAAAVERMSWDTGQWPGGKAITLDPQTVNDEFTDLTLGSVGLVANDGRFNNWRGPYVDRIPRDPWGTRYFFDADYKVRNTGPWVIVVGSFGPNRVGMNRYDNDDIVHDITQIYNMTR